MALRGYHVMVIVLGLMVCAAITLCYITWRLRYKITLRTGTVNPGLTYVQEKLLETYNDLEAAETAAETMGQGQIMLPRNSHPTRRITTNPRNANSRAQLPRTLSSVKFSSGKVMSLSNTQKPLSPRWKQLRDHITTDMSKDQSSPDDPNQDPRLGELGGKVRRDTEESEEFEQCIIPSTLRDTREFGGFVQMDPLVLATREPSGDTSTPTPVHLSPLSARPALSRSSSHPVTSPGHSRPPSFNTILEHSE